MHGFYLICFIVLISFDVSKTQTISVFFFLLFINLCHSKRATTCYLKWNGEKREKERDRESGREIELRETETNPYVVIKKVNG